ncbi:ABC transporter substrate-binding protein [Colwellia psychrerythraea]|uniref:ABC transporter substrate-binding protein n=1 Tax=Colwellia psychrerythraea TaxID=28229 RepID=UPI001E33472C|nr:ABC transporter substrate-binding protein [Colwellia psychrerythraea]
MKFFNNLIVKTNCLLLIMLMSSSISYAEKQSIKAIYIPLADHYASIIAYEKYRDKMVHADFSLEQMKNWDLLRAYFQSGEVDMAFVMSPLAMDMFRERPKARWVGMMHRDGNALAINDLLNKEIKLPHKRIDRKPDEKAANAFTKASKAQNKPIEVGVPHLMATHSVVLYKYLKEHGKTLAIGRGTNEDAVIIGIAPPKAPAFIKKKNSRNQAAAFEQSLPWADVVETQKFGHVAWYSKDVMQWPNGHVECIVLAQDKSIKDKKEAIREVIHYMKKAGEDIEIARRQGGQAMIDIATMVRKHIPKHNESAIIQSLRPDLNVINYRHLDNDEAGLKVIMDLAVEAGIISQSININSFSDRQFSSEFNINNE